MIFKKNHNSLLSMKLGSKAIGIHLSGFETLLSASPVVIITLLILGTLSVMCWGIILLKKRQIKKIRRSNTSFSNEFWKTTSLDTLFSRLEEFPYSNLAQIFRSGYQEMQRIAQSGLASTESQRLSGLDNLERTLRKAVDLEISSLENYLNILATTGSTGPFIGLFGTVWGIMGSFKKIGETGAASLAVVAPGISEALIATAIGLAAAIPAVVAYNYFLSQIKREELELTHFASDFLNVVKRHFFVG